MFLKNKSYPRLRGRAADIRGLPDTILWDANMIEGDMTHRQIRMVLALNVNANTLETYSPMFGYFAVPGALSFLTGINLRRSKLEEFYQRKLIVYLPLSHSFPCQWQSTCPTKQASPLHGSLYLMKYSLPCTVRKKHVALALEDRGKDSELTKAEWEGAQLVLNACKKEFEKFSGQLKTILKDIGCNDPKDHLFLKVILTLVYLLLACNCK